MREADQVARDLAARVEGEVLAGRAARSLYATDASIYRRLPLCVVRVKSLQDAAAAVAYCAEEGIPLAPRGAGTGLAGESLTRGVVLDFSVHLRAIGPVETDEVWVEAGVVPDVLNRALRSRGLLFGPDPATSDRCTVGGMVGINSTGGHSLVYGDTRRRLRALEVVLSDGAPAVLAPGPAPDSGARGLDGLLARTAALARKAQALRLPFAPTLARNRHGYLLWEALRGDRLDPTQVVAGSEGTLAVVVRAKLALDPAPAARTMLLMQFSDRIAPLRLVTEALAFKPAALEFMDDVVLRMAKDMPAFAPVIASGAGSWLIASFEGTAEEARGALHAAAEGLRGAPCLAAMEAVEDPRRQSLINAVRQVAVPLLFRRRDGYIPLPFIEDAAVPPERLADYIEQVEGILGRHGLRMTCYAHAGSGELHIRPFMRPWRQIDLMPRIAEEVLECALRHGGTASGEHGDGLLRSFFVRRQYGDEMWGLFKELKAAFDPAGILNPGKKVVEERELPLDGLRYPRGEAVFGLPLAGEELRFGGEELARAAFACTGCGSCRTVKDTERMCPVFRATGLEEASPRAKLNLLRDLAMGNVSLADDLRAVLDLCLWCRSCGRECPSGLSVPEAIIELRGRAVRARGLNAGERAAASLPVLAAAGAALPRLATFFQGRASVRALVERLLGIDAGKPLPAFARRRFCRAPAREPLPVPPGKTGVAFFADLFVDCFAPELGRRAVATLEAAGCAVVIPRQEPCGVVPLVYGRIDAARAVAARNEAALRPFVEAGYAVVTPEPTAALMLRSDYARLLGRPSPVCEGAFELGAFLYARRRAGAWTPRALPRAGRLAYHCACHLKELEGPGFRDLCAETAGIELEPLPESCCGMAGTFGLRRGHRGLSAAIGAPLIAALKEGAFTAVVSECASCRLQLGAESGLPALHPLELFAP